jgi:hypothetical protein
MWAPPRSGVGRWIMAHRPASRRENNAASLSSGVMTGPSRCTLWKSVVVARETSGPSRL